MDNNLNISPKTARSKRFAFPLHMMEERTQAITKIIFTLVALSVFGLLAISPTLSTIAQLRKQLSDSKSVDAQLKEKIGNLTNLSNQYATIKPDLPLIFDVLPIKPNVPFFLAQLQSLASQSNVQLNNLQIFQVDLTKNAKVSGPSSFSFSFTASGSYQDISSFISSVINFNRLIGIEAVSINQGLNGNTDLSLRGKAYFKK